MLSTLPLVLVHPWGLEEAVASDFRRIAADFPHVQCDLQQHTTSNDSQSEDVNSTSASPPRGMQKMQLNLPTSPSSSSSSGAPSPSCVTSQQLHHVVPFLDALHRNRLTEQVCLHLWTTDCVESCNELDATFEQHKEHTFVMVHTVLGTLRKLMVNDPAASRDPTLSANVEFHESISDPQRIRFRVNASRRDKLKSGKGKFSSQDLCVHVGTLFYEAYNPMGWGVDMLYQNVEILVLLDDGVATCCLAIYPPNLPRTGCEAHPVDGITRELLRQFVACKHYLIDQRIAQVANCNTLGPVVVDPPACSDEVHESSADEHKKAVPEYKGFVCRPSHFKLDVRCSKGDNAMHPSIASALTLFADVQDGDVVVDPTVGSGTVLLEAWLRYVVREDKYVRLVGGDMRREYGVRTHANYNGLVEAAFVSGLLRQSSSVDTAEGGGAAGGSSRAWQIPLFQFARPENVANVASPTEPFRWVEDGWQECLETARKLFPTSMRPTQTSIVGTALQSNGMKLPLQTSLVDVVISDMPFGRRCGTHGINAKLYPSLLKEIHRVLKKGTQSPSVSNADESNNKPAGDHHNRSGTEWWKRQSGSSGTAGRCVLLTVEGKLLLAASVCVCTGCFGGW
ncbi:Hypothetical protein, putative [Bodo saltans]|uniref:Ribosomal RNA large subunit methyltransferase K/L-like methyltransferase domain-containing protein n=1 Tax=Bodo saltans TaxID=75058 RepID=A0A0S4J990_BODSA|nr:Hypothetical protein, putative [Bodo saltans]|eukprot:CUG86530.1 Hypothetical protein, putative [Bodo saltans]